MEILANQQSLRSILDGVYRLNPVLTLVEHTKLTTQGRVAFDRLAEDPGHFGVLVSHKIPELGVQAVEKGGAQLLSRLLIPGRVSDCVSDPLELARLVLDGILEYRYKGNFVTGPAAYSALFHEPVPTQNPADNIAAMSFEALRLAQQLTTTDAKQIAAWLYRFNCIPFSPTWARCLANPKLIEEYLGLGPNGNVRCLLEEHFTAFEVLGWRAWRRVGTVDSVETSPLVYKLYISPHPSVLPKAFFDTVDLFARSGVTAFKMGNNAHGLLRPDKLIAYFQEYALLDEMAALLSGKLGRYKAQGVPYTASLASDGILSWGVDPPRDEAIPGWQDVLSWRQWITDRLARSILRARILGSGGVEPWQFALARLSLDGVNTEHWLPSGVQFKKV